MEPGAGFCPPEPDRKSRAAQNSARQIPGFARDGLSRRQRVGRRVALRRLGRLEKHVAGDGRDPRRATRERIGERGEIRHRRRLAAVERILNGPAPLAGLQIDEIRDVARGDAETERRTLDRRAVEELRVGPDRCDGRHFVDCEVRRGAPAQHRQKRQRRIFARALVDRGDAALRDHIEARARSGRLVRAEHKTPVVRRCRLRQLFGFASAPGP